MKEKYERDDLRHDLDKQFDIQKQHREIQVKYIYYLIGLSVSAIAFSVYQTTDHRLKESHFMLLIAVSSWAFSIYCGLRLIKLTLGNLELNNEYMAIEMQEAQNGGDVSIAWQKYQYKLKPINKELYRNHNWQWRFFFLGVLFFIFWHVLEMYLLHYEIGIAYYV